MPAPSRLALAVVSVAGFLAGAVTALAQDAGAPVAAPAQPKWSTQCVGEGRLGPFVCSMQQSAVVSQTGQLVASVTIRVGASGGPEIRLQVPVGLYLPAGVTLQVDDTPGQPIALDTCDADGCFVVTAMDEAMLQSLRGGARLTVTVQNFARKTLSVPFELAGFTAAYQKIQPQG